MNSSCFKFHRSLCSLSLSNVVSLSWIHVLHKTTEISQCHVLVVQRVQGNVQKSCSSNLSLRLFLVFCCPRCRRHGFPHLKAPNEEPSFLFYLDIFPWFSKAWKPACSQWYKSRINLEAQASYLKIPFNKFVLNLTQHRISIIKLKVYAALSRENADDGYNSIKSQNNCVPLTSDYSFRSR